MTVTIPPLIDIHHLTGLDPAGRLVALVSSAAGLSAAEATKRLTSYGSNTPVREVRTRPLLAFAANFIHTLALLLWFAAGLAFAAGAPELGGAIVAVVVVNGVFAFLQEYRAEQVVQSLMRSVAVQARVVRDGVEIRLAAESLVPGDVIRVAAGDITPADAVLLADDNLTLDLSMITGESKPVERSAAAAAPAEGSTLVDLSAAVPGGAAVVTGTAEAVVCATGPESTMGRVASLVEGVERGGSMLEQQVARLSMVTAIIAVFAGTSTLLLAAAFTNTQFVAALTFATGVIVALVPEGLLPTLSISLAIGARRMAARGAAVRRLSAVEVIGSVTVICTDKTGTLTQNAISVLGIVTEGEGDTGARPLEAAVLCNDARAADHGFEGDAVDVALLQYAVAQGADVTAIRAASARVADVPFDAQHRYMSVTCERDGRRVDYIKGAPEEVLALTRATPTAALATAIEEVTQRGERVLLLAVVEPGTATEILGLVRMFDPPRPEVPAAIAAARRAGIRIVMLTGDHPVTASTVATTIGFAAGDMTVVEGRELDGLADSALLAILRRDAIFARIDPAQKLRIVTLLRRAGEVVVATGDGINDAPALRAADVGVAMGLRGSEVAKQAADVVLADDNFATIVAAIEEGRAIKANIRRFVSYVFTHDVAELAPFLIYIFLPVPLPLAIMQVLAIDLGTDLLPSLALGAEPPSAETMGLRPEPPQRPLLTRPLGVKTFLFFGLIEALLGLLGFFAYHYAAGWRPFDTLSGYSSSFEHRATTLTFLGIVSGQLGCLFASRDGSLWRRLSLRSNRWIAVGLGFELALTLALVYVPGLNGVFSMAGVSPAWLAVLPCGAAIFLVLDEARRAVAGRIAK